MKHLFKSQPLAIGLAMFSMFFGAGNIIFPLAIGQYAGDKNFYAMLGLILTGVIMPIAGVLAMILFDGNYKQFFGRLGKGPGFLVALITISLLGPFGSTPRCIALAYSTLSTVFPMLSPYIFGAAACILIFLLTFRKSHILNILGWVLTPLLLTSLFAIILVGLIDIPDLEEKTLAPAHLFFHGLKEGYNTMDLLAAFFFSSTILNLLRLRLKENEKYPGSYLHTASQASCIGALLLGVVYIGFSYLAAFHGQDLGSLGKDQLLSAITLKIAGPYAGILVCIAIALACLTTAIALITAYTDFMQREVFKNKISFEATLIGALLLTFLVSTFEFTRISLFLGPILQLCYPGLIALTFLNIAYKLKGLKPIKIPIAIVFLLSIYYYVQFSGIL